MNTLLSLIRNWVKSSPDDAVRYGTVHINFGVLVLRLRQEPFAPQGQMAATVCSCDRNIDWLEIETARLHFEFASKEIDKAWKTWKETK